MVVRLLLVTLLLTTGAGTLVAAQERSRAYLDVTLGANALLSNGPINDKYYSRSAPMVLLSLGTQPDSARAFMAAIHVGLLNAIGHGSDVCHLTPLGGCFEDYPLSSIVAVTFGGRPLTSAWRFLQVTAGPAYVGHLEGANSFGALMIGRAGHAPGHYVSAGLAFHGLVTTIDGNLVFATGIGFNVRTW